MYRRISTGTFTLPQDVIYNYWRRGELGIWFSKCGRCYIRFTRTKLWELTAGPETKTYAHLWQAKLEGIRRIRAHESIINAT